MSDSSLRNSLTTSAVIHVQNGTKAIQTNLKAVVHSVPFKIHADCDAKVEKFFNSGIKNGNDYLKTSFRGYPLSGEKVSVPDGYRAVILQETLRPVSTKEERKFYVIHTFNDLTYWNWDKKPSRNDAFYRALEWTEIAEALHSPILEE